MIFIKKYKPYTFEHRWGISSVGRAFEWHSKGQGFESPILHSYYTRTYDKIEEQKISLFLPIVVKL